MTPEAAEELERLILDASSADEATAEPAGRRLESLCAAGHADAQRVALIMLYHASLFGELTYSEFAFRAEQIIRFALHSGTIRDLFYFTGNDKTARSAQTEYLCILDRMADNGNDAAARAVEDMSGILPADVLQQAKSLSAIMEPPAFGTDYLPGPDTGPDGLNELPLVTAIDAPSALLGDGDGLTITFRRGA